MTKHNKKRNVGLINELFLKHISNCLIENNLNSLKVLIGGKFGIPLPILSPKNFFLKLLFLKTWVKKMLLYFFGSKEIFNNA